MATYFKNTELAARYNISEATVRNWIKAAKKGKIQLELMTDGGRSYVARSISNISLIEKLIKRNRKYRNKLVAKTITPSQKLFNVFNEAQVYDIVRNLELHNEIPRQYGYFESGVKEWDKYINKQIAVDTPSMLRRTIELLAYNYSYLDERLAPFKKVNVIDIGVGNAVPVKDLLTHLLEQDKLGRYVALDFSEGMLGLARRRLREWFGKRIHFEGYQLDITYERFANIVAEDYLESGENIVNLVLFLGATPNNLRVPIDAFRTICESMNSQDLLIYTDKLEPPGAPPEWFEYEVKHGKPEVTRQHRLVFDLLNIKESFYDIEIGFNKETNQRYAWTRFKVALTLTFLFPQGQKRTIHFEKGDTITLWRCWQTTPRSLVDLLEASGFYVLHTSQSEDRSYILTIAEVQHAQR